MAIEWKSGSSRPESTAPATIALRNTAFEGQVEARWGRVANAHYYEVKALISGENPDPTVWDSLPVFANGPASYLFKDQPVGSFLSVRTRAIGSKGPSPWTEAATVRIS